AIGMFDKARTLKPEDPSTYVNMGICYQSKGDFKHAVEISQKGIEIIEQTKNKGNLAAAYYNLGNIYADAGQTEEALSSYNQSLKIEKNSPLALSGVGWMLARKGNYEDAIKIQRKLLKELPDFTVARGRLAEALADQGKDEEARKE